VCETEPTWLFDELTGVNDLLSNFLDRTPAHGATWSDEQIPLLEEASRTLPRVVQAHADNLALVSRCAYSELGAWPELVKRGHKLVGEARQQLGEAPQVLAFARKRQLLERWEKDRARDEESARAGCDARDGGPSPFIYFAWQDDLGRTYWLFCDGAEVTTPTTFGAAEWSPPPGVTKTTAAAGEEGSYLGAVKFYPDKSVRRPP